jgi:cell division protein FtsW
MARRGNDGLATTAIARQRPDLWLLSLIGALCLLGLVMVYSASYATAAEALGSGTYQLLKQGMYLAFGWVALFVMMRVDYHVWRRFALPAMVMAVALLILVLIIPSSNLNDVNGAKRWIFIGSQGFQPSELAKLAFVLYLASWLSLRGSDKLGNLTRGLIPFGFVLGLVFTLIMREPDMGSSLVFVCIGVGMFFVAGADLLHLAAGMILAAGTFVLLIQAAPYRSGRIDSWLNPWSDPQGSGYHAIQSMVALGSGGFFGLGLGASRQKFSWLPEQYTDTIFSIIGEELGMVGAMLVILLFGSLVYRGYRVALHAPDSFGALLATGITSWFGFQALINIGAVTNSIPFTGITLPFISAGGSALIFALAGAGVLLNISKQTEMPAPSRK